MKSNQKIIRDLKKGKTATFKEIYFLYYDKLFHICKKFNLMVLTPQDLIQEVFLKIHKNRHQLKEDVPLEAQIIVICKNLIFNHLNREKKIIPLQTGFLKDELLQDDLEYDTNFRKENLYKLIEELPVQQKKIFKLHKIDNYSYREIANLTQLSPKTIANHIYLANNFIRKNIKKA
ncbi:RNA polymerase sigma factor [Zunongwangia pacifica]|uniref:Sigma-70 family RNA polymerase sigma factor n=1 Tax=Zunongwangia pacifica TaxID=2911062 RepID=A0A9X2CP39_9FLAO|nr:sigma-70 family RNA polymerase sigma factor [Zunongwangia pacifica]MCL6219464.1 sigma-70 family RNA polymerase sigma factor [Zunongwangia pacifica]